MSEDTPKKPPPLNVLRGALQHCCDAVDDPSALPEKDGEPVVCVVVTEAFVAYARSTGDDEAAKSGAAGLGGFRAGARWLLRASRWKAALIAGKAPGVILAATPIAALDVLPLELLKAHAIDLN